MTTSWTTYQERGFWADDTTIELWLHLLVKTSSGAGQPDWVTTARRDWDRQASVGFLGCVTVGLDDHLGGDPVRERQFLALVATLDDHVRALGPTIPAATATGFGIGGRTTFTADVDAKILHEFSAAVTELVTENRTGR